MPSEHTPQHTLPDSMHRYTLLLRKESSPRGFAYSTTFEDQPGSLSRIALCPADVRAFGRIHANLLTLVDERRHRNHKPRLHLRRLGHRRRRRRLDARLGLHHRHLNYARQLDADSLAVVVAHADAQIWNQILHRVAKCFALQHRLLKRLIHEVVVVAVVVQKLHLHLINDDTVDGIGRTKALNEHRARADVS